MKAVLRRLGLSRGPTLGSSEFGSRDVTDEHNHEPVEILGEVPNYVRGTFYRQSGGAFVDDGFKRGKKNTPCIVSSASESVFDFACESCVVRDFALL